MKVEGSYTLSAPRDVVWEALNDPDILSKTIPGGQELEQTAENEYRAKMKIKVGPVQGVFDGKVQLSNLNPPEGYHMQVDGRGAPGFVKGEGNLRLEPQGDQTVLHYEGDAQVGGRLASVGQRLMDTSAQALIRQSLETLEAQIQARQQGQESGTPAAEIAAPTQIQFAAGVTRKIIEDALPQEKRPELFRAGLIALAAVFILKSLLDWWTDRLARRVADRLEKRR